MLRIAFGNAAMNAGLTSLMKPASTTSPTPRARSSATIARSYDSRLG
jgi:hypothetical protein